MDFKILPFAPENLEELAQLAERLNGKRETASAFCCTGKAEIRRDFEHNMPYGHACFLDGRPVGLWNGYLDAEKKNADCSLMLGLTGKAYQEAAGALCSAAKSRLGQGVACTFFFPQENADCRQFLEQAGAKRQVNEYILVLQRQDWAEPGSLTAWPRKVQDGERDAFAALHDAVFPGVYCSGRDILAGLWADRFVYVIADGAGLAAYGVLKTKGGERATAEVIAVREDVRGRGYGRAVLNHLAKQAFSEFGAKSLDLVVEADNQNALALYLDTGFLVSQENNCYILS